MIEELKFELLTSVLKNEAELEEFKSCNKVEFKRKLDLIPNTLPSRSLDDAIKSIRKLGPASDIPHPVEFQWPSV